MENSYAGGGSGECGVGAGASCQLKGSFREKLTEKVTWL